MLFPLIVLAAVFMLIAVRQAGNIKLHIWQVMLLGALTVALTGQISPASALKSINFDVMLFLFEHWKKAAIFRIFPTGFSGGHALQTCSFCLFCSEVALPRHCF